MREDWKTIPFEQSIEKVKYTSKIASSEYLEEGTYPIVSQEEGLISGYWNNDEDVFRLSKPVVIFGDHTRALKYVDFDFVLGADGVKILQPIEQIDTKFFFYYLQSCKIPSLGYSRHYKLLKELKTPIPPLPEQERIVAELDCLSSIIEKQKEQLKELDNLAQSIFYTMFGDPITNEKGWEIRKLGDICNSELGKMLDTKRAKGEYHPYLCALNVQWGAFNMDVVKEMRIEENELERYTIKNGDVLICEGGDTGRTAIWNSDNTIYYQNSLHRVRLHKDKLLSAVFLHIMHILKASGEIDKYSTGQTIKHLVKKSLLSIPLIIPALSLQQDFASKIEAIEKQKELIKQSIAESETLFNSRMDYYFN